MGSKGFPISMMLFAAVIVCGAFVGGVDARAEPIAGDMNSASVDPVLGDDEGKGGFVVDVSGDDAEPTGVFFRDDPPHDPDGPVEEDGDEAAVGEKEEPEDPTAGYVAPDDDEKKSADADADAADVKDERSDAEKAAEKAEMEEADKAQAEEEAAAGVVEEDSDSSSAAAGIGDNAEVDPGAMAAAAAADAAAAAEAEANTA